MRRKAASTAARSRAGTPAASASLADRPEDTILLVAHSLPLAYLRDAAAGTAPRSRMDMIEYAQVVRVDLGELEQAVGVLEAWASAPAF